MTVSQEIANLQDLVYELLVNDERLRDSDRKLSARVWTIQLGGLESLKSSSAYDFLCLYTEEKKLFSQESIGRARRLIQESHVELRGKNYNARQEEQDRVKKVVNDSDSNSPEKDSEKTDEEKTDKEINTEENLPNQTK